MCKEIPVPYLCVHAPTGSVSNGTVRYRREILAHESRDLTALFMALCILAVVCCAGRREERGSGASVSGLRMQVGWAQLIFLN